MICYRTLQHVEMKVLYNAFIACFEDYIVSIQMPYDKFEKMMTRRGYVGELSIGAFDDENLIGFIFNGRRKWENKETIYDMGTAVIKEYRKQGITTGLLNELQSYIQNSEIEQYLLEVIQENTPAYQLYQKQGFEVVRSFACLTAEKKKIESKMNHEVTIVNQLCWDEAITFWDIAPSWQNSIESIMTDPDMFIFAIVKYEERFIGYGIIDKSNGEIVQIAVDEKYRNLGVATSIIAKLTEDVSVDIIRILNIDDSNQQLLTFLKNRGFVEDMNQFEMIKLLNK
ncbi:MAG: GNAT family N-acetyltransferase [Culicoidibacterales bacterium]